MAGIEGKLPTAWSEIPDILGRIFESLRRNAYPLARLDSAILSKLGAPRLDLHLSEGKPVRISDITSSSDFRNELESWLGKELTETDIARKSNVILERLSDEGYPFATVTISPSEVDEGDDEFRLKLRVAVGRDGFMRIGSVAFPGRTHTTERYLRLESRLNRGNTFRRSEMETALQRLKRLEFIADAGPVELNRESPGIVGVHIPVRERRSNRFSGIVALAPQDDRPTGELVIGFHNLFGTGRQLDFSWLALNPARRGIVVEYGEPWIFQLPVRLAAKLEQWVEDTLGTTTRYRFEASWEPLNRLMAKGGIEWESIHRGMEETMGLSLRTLWFSGGIELDNLDRRWNPGDGYRIEVASSSGLREGSDDASWTIRKDMASLEGVLPFTADFLFYGRGLHRDVSGEGIQLEDLVRIGGTGSVRGYSEQRWLVRGAILSSVELRWRSGRDGYLGLFGDAGSVYRADPEQPVENWLSSFGITGGISTAAGRLNLDVGLARGEPIERARLHIRLESRF